MILNVSRIGILVMVAATLAACDTRRAATGPSAPNPYAVPAQSPSAAVDGTNGYATRGASDPTVYPGPLSNVMDCSRLTLAQRQHVNVYRYGCEDLPSRDFHSEQ
jgi:hypothetical protein